ncbi:hypothetical Protein YC6258_00876 [Gynuella sunshinyii YC6258]|uniref:Uncharacterized protein n=1 Tax=Gynuella sunshinyii YC6258 TaxID=1445510 RepID=A0A0C5VFH3_9GAMM|nr:hypothetical Protein YC6258_00876 [Gynuella sunshinyii YC6258]
MAFRCYGGDFADVNFFIRLLYMATEYVEEVSHDNDLFMGVGSFQPPFKKPPCLFQRFAC